MAPPTKLTPALTTTFAKAIAQGSTFETAAALVGVSPASARTWLRRGAREQARRDEGHDPSEELYMDFHVVVTKALADGEGQLVAAIREATTRQWQAAAWLLERRHPRTWGQRPAAREALLGELIDQLLDAIEGQVDVDTFSKVARALAGDVGDSRARGADSVRHA